MDASNGFLACMPTMPELPPDCPVWTHWREIEENQWTRALLHLKPVKPADALADADSVAYAGAVICHSQEAQIFYILYFIFYILHFTFYILHFTLYSGLRPVWQPQEKHLTHQVERCQLSGGEETHLLLFNELFVSYQKFRVDFQLALIPLSYWKSTRNLKY